MLVVLPGGGVCYSGEKVYYSVYAPDAERTVKRANLDSTGVETVLTNPAPPRFYGIAFDEANAHLYGGDGSHLFRCNLDGTNRVNLVPSRAGDVELDLVNCKVCWTNATQGLPSGRGIFRANLDGSNIETLASIGPNDVAMGIAVDPTGAKLYYVYNEWPTTMQVRSMGLDGSNNTLFKDLPGGAYPYDVEFDSVEPELYWNEMWPGDDQRRSIVRADLEGTIVQTILTPLSPPDSWFHVDVANRDLYFPLSNVVDPTSTYLARSNLDGSGVELVLHEPSGVIRNMEVCIPEPSTGALLIMLVGTGVVVWLARRRRREARGT